MDHLQEELTCVQKDIADSSLPQPDDSIVSKLFAVLKETTKSHSKRPNSAKVRHNIIRSDSVHV